MNKETRSSLAMLKSIIGVFLSSAVLYSQSAYTSSNSLVDSVPVPPRARLEVINENLQPVSYTHLTLPTTPYV